MFGRALYTIFRSGSILADLDNADRVIKLATRPDINAHLGRGLLSFGDVMADVAGGLDEAISGARLNNVDLEDGARMYARNASRLALLSTKASKGSHERIRYLGEAYACFLLAITYLLQMHLNRSAGAARYRIREKLFELRRVADDALAQPRR